MFEFTKLSNIIRIRFTAKISFKMPKEGRHTDKGSPPIIACLSSFFSLLFSSFSLYHTVNDKHHWNLVSRSQTCLVVLNLPEFINKSYCLLLAVQRDSPNCKKHSEKNNSHEREHDLRRDVKLRIVVTESLTRSSKKQNLVRKSKGRAVAKDQGNVRKGKSVSSTTELVSQNGETKRRFWSKFRL